MHVLLNIALWYLIMGLLFAIATFLGSREACPNFSLEERIHLSLTAIVIWGYAVYRVIVDLIDDRKYRSRK